MSKSELVYFLTCWHGYWNLAVAVRAEANLFVEDDAELWSSDVAWRTLWQTSTW